MAEDETIVRYQVGEQVWSQDYQAVGTVVEAQALWGDTFYRLWLPSHETTLRIAEGRLCPVDEAGAASAADVAYTVTAARVAALLAEPNVLLAPIGAPVVPLPHQVRALARVTADPRQVRYLLADEVGLGKTIEAGLILRELKLRGLVQRTLVVAPKSLVIQWVAELRTHFGEDFRLLVPGEAIGGRRLGADENMWQRFDQVVCPMDSVKPLEGRRGWSREQVARYNRERFEDLALAGWDLVIVDEAHRLGGSTSEVARYKLGQGLANAAPYLLLLSATPHQGKSDGFHRLVALLDPVAFPTVDSLTHDRVRPYVIRTEKRQAIDAEGRPLFVPRETRLVPVAWQDRHHAQAALYEAVTDYVREGYNQARRERNNAIGFLMLLMQRLVTSSTRAIRLALERRLEVLQGPEAERLGGELGAEEWVELDGQEQLDLVVSAAAALRNERSEVEHLLALARVCEARGADAKAEELRGLLYRLQQEEGDPRVKLLVFTEFVPTQEMLRETLEAQGVSVACLNGSMDLEARAAAQREFAGAARVLISTDAGGEGLNLQFCHLVLNYDIPWNPMRLEQRIGRVDRIGQTHPVRAFNYVLEGTVEHRVREVLEQKLARILREFGVDKAGDVLDSAEASPLFEQLYAEALLDPSSVESSADRVAEDVLDQARAERDQLSLYTIEEALDPSAARGLREHPLPYWLERMASVRGTSTTLGDPQLLRALSRLPTQAAGQPIPRLRLEDLAPDLCGFWSLWEIRLVVAALQDGVDDYGRTGVLRRRFVPLFVHDDGRCLLPTARAIWERLLSEEVSPGEPITGPAASRIWEQVRTVAEGQTASTYAELAREHERWLEREREKLSYGFQARSRVIEQLGLPEVRAHRRAVLTEETRADQARLERARAVLPELTPLLIARIEGTGAGG